MTSLPSVRRNYASHRRHHFSRPSAGNYAKAVDLVSYVAGTLSNQGDEPIAGHFILGFHLHLGSHVGAFRQMYYEDDYLFSGNLHIQGPTVLATRE